MTISGSSQRFTERMVMIVATLSTGMVYLDQFAVNVALPSIQAELGTTLGGLQWLVDIYLLTLVSLMLIGGALGDRYGRVRVYIIGMVIFVAASAANGLAQTLGFMVAARAVQGVGAALMVPGGLAIINAAVAPERRGRVMGTWVTYASFVIVLGPLLGGWLVDYVSWRSVFFINIPLGLLGCFVAIRYVAESRNEASSPLNWPGVVMLMLGLGTLLFGLIEGPHIGWDSPVISGALIVGLLGLVGFIIVEARSSAPMIPLDLYRNRNFSGINLATLIQWIAVSGILFFLTLNLQQVQGYSAFAAGLAILPISLSVIALAKPIGKLTDVVGPLWILVIGLLVATGSFILFSRAGLETSYWTVFFPAILMFGLGMGITIVPITTVAMGALPSSYSGIASGVNNTASRLAFMLGIAIFGTIMVMVFRGVLVEQLAALPLEPATRGQLLAEARNLGATTPSSNLTPDVARATSEAIRLAFVESFRQIMYLCAAITLVSLAVVLMLVRFPVVRPVSIERQTPAMPLADPPGDSRRL